MAEITLVAEPGRATGSRESRRLRTAGRIPAVVYGHGAEAVSVSVDGRDLRHALSGASGANQLLELRIGSDRHLALARALQRHPVRHTVVHVDFQIVSRDEVISADVPVVLIGEAKAVELEQGMVEQQLTSLTINATPGRIPASIEVDINDLKVGDAIRVGDLRLPSGVTTDVPDDEMIVLGALSGASVGAAPVEAGETAAEDTAEGEAGGEERAASGEASAGDGEGEA